MQAITETGRYGDMETDLRYNLVIRIAQLSVYDKLFLSQTSPCPLCFVGKTLIISSFQDRPADSSEWREELVWLEEHQLSAGTDEV